MLLEDPMEDDSIPSVKDLASSEPALRRQNLNQLLSHLSSRPTTTPPTPTQCLQLWRGFSVALYMHDSKNALSVQTLIATLAGTLTTVYEKDLAQRADLKLTDGSGHELCPDGETRAEEQFPWLTRWTRAFWETISREWSGIDQWRMNKYLSLVRFVVRETFTILYAASRDETKAADSASLLSSQEEVLEAFPLSASERKVPDGLRLHVLDIWTEELMRAEKEDGEKGEIEEGKSASSHISKELMRPIQRLSENSISKSVKKKAKEIIKAQNSEEME